jgi:pimeloyl-ACP methyl ester carboxylesterase
VRSRMTFVLSFLSFVALAPQAHAQSIVVPNALESVEPNSNLIDPNNVLRRLQQVYGASQFASLNGPVLVTEIDFRPGRGFVGFPAHSWTLSDAQITLSTTSGGPDSLSSIWTNNTGNDATLVYSGPLTLSSTFTSSNGTTADFDIVVTLQTPFLYDRSKGNLLLDITNHSSVSFLNVPFSRTLFQGFPVSYVSGFSVDSVSGSNTRNSGFVTRFRFSEALPRPTFPVIFIHGICSDASTWDSVKLALKNGGWRFGGTLTTPFNDALIAADADFYRVEFFDPFILNGLSSWGTDVASDIVGLNVLRLRRGLRKTAFIIVAHSAGGLAARSYIQSLSAIAFQHDVHHLITYGTPHVGAHANALIGLAALPGNRCSGGLGELGISQGVTDMSAGRFLRVLNNRALPLDVRYTSLVGLGCVFGDCAVSGLSQNIQSVNAPLAETFFTFRSHIDFFPLHGETSDVATILWAINRDAVLGTNRLSFNVASPVDVIVTDPLGRVLSKTANSIGLASYEEIETPTGDRHDTVIIPVAIQGTYQVQVVPEPGASPLSTFTLTVAKNSSSFVLANRVQIKDILPTGYLVDIAPTIDAAIDIDPDDADNEIELESGGHVEVAILSSMTFNAPRQVDPKTLTFGRTGFEPSLRSCEDDDEDVNGDRLPDLVCRFRLRLTGFRIGDTSGILRAQTHDGTLLVGSDVVSIKPKE